MAFSHSGFGQFMASSAGRVVRIIAGIALILLGIFGMEGIGGWIVAIIGLVPLSVGLFDFCVISALVGGPFSGSQIRGQG